MTRMTCAASVKLGPTTCQLSYPLTSESASPPGTFRVYLFCLCCAEVAQPPKTTSTSAMIPANKGRILFMAHSSCVDLKFGNWSDRELAKLMPRIIGQVKAVVNVQRTTPNDSARQEQSPFVPFSTCAAGAARARRPGHGTPAESTGLQKPETGVPAKEATRKPQNFAIGAKLCAAKAEADPSHRSQKARTSSG